MTDWQTTIAGIVLWVFLWFVWKAGYGAGYQERTCETDVVEEDEEPEDTPTVPKFQWPTCDECGHGISVHRCWKDQWQSSCACGFAWCDSPYEALQCTERPHLGEGSRSGLKDPSNFKKVENDVGPPQNVVVKKNLVG